jgi:hypothetical protein
MLHRNSSAGTAAQQSSKSSLIQRPAIILAMLLLCAVLSTEAQTFKESTWNPYELTGKMDTVNRYYVEVDSFLIQYVHSGGYMETAVGRMICEIDSSRKDTMNIIDGSTGKERQEIWFGRKNCREDTAFYNADRHYYSHIQVYSVVNGKRTPIGKEQYGYYVPHGCYEDVPENWVATAKKQGVSK